MKKVTCSFKFSLLGGRNSQISSSVQMLPLSSCLKPHFYWMLRLRSSNVNLMYNDKITRSVILCYSNFMSHKVIYKNKSDLCLYVCVWQSVWRDVHAHMYVCMSCYVLFVMSYWCWDAAWLPIKEEKAGNYKKQPSSHLCCIFNVHKDTGRHKFICWSVTLKISLFITRCSK